jgi:hypothetical protein
VSVDSSGGLPGTGDRVRLILHRFLDEPVGPGTLTGEEDDLWLHPSLGCDPVRTGVAMLLSVGLALGAARAGGRRFSTQLTRQSKFRVSTDDGQLAADRALETQAGQSLRQSAGGRCRSRR